MFLYHLMVGDQDYSSNNSKWLATLNVTIKHQSSFHFSSTFFAYLQDTIKEK